MPWLWASQGCVGRPHCITPAVTGSLLGKALMAEALGRSSAACLAWGLADLMLYFDYFQNSWRVTGGGGSCLKTPHNDTTVEPPHREQSPSRGLVCLGEAGSSPGSSRLRLSCTWSPVLRSWVWVRSWGPRGKDKEAIPHHPPPHPASPAGHLPPCPLAAHPRAGLLPDYLSRNFYCSPQRHCSLAGMWKVLAARVGMQRRRPLACSQAECGRCASIASGPVWALCCLFVPSFCLRLVPVRFDHFPSRDWRYKSQENSPKSKTSPEQPLCARKHIAQHCPCAMESSQPPGNSSYH